MRCATRLRARARRTARRRRADACRAFARLLLEALAGRTPALSWSEPVRGGGYVVEALNAAQWAVGTTASYEAAILAAANLGDDADTTAAIAGQLAGARYGLGGIPERWRSRVYASEEIVALADRLHALSDSMA